MRTSAFVTDWLVARRSRVGEKLCRNATRCDCLVDVVQHAPPLIGRSLTEDATEECGEVGVAEGTADWPVSLK